MNVLNAFRDRPFLHLFLGSALALVLLVFISCRIAWHDMPASELVGTYHRAPAMFLPVAGLPEKLVLRDDGTMAFFDAQGRSVYNGPWRWDRKEGVLLSDVPRWDRQVRMRNTLGGMRLCMRVDTTDILHDEPEQDEEVDLVKDASSTALPEY